MEIINAIGLLLLAIWFAFVAGYALYHTFRQATIIEKIEMARQLVILAESAFTEAKAGPRRYLYVLTRLRQLYPNETQANLESWIENAVEWMKAREGDNA